MHKSTYVKLLAGASAMMLLSQCLDGDYEMFDDAPRAAEHKSDDGGLLETLGLSGDTQPQESAAPAPQSTTLTPTEAEAAPQQSGDLLGFLTSGAATAGQAASSAGATAATATAAAPKSTPKPAAKPSGASSQPAQSSSPKPTVVTAPTVPTTTATQTQGTPKAQPNITVTTPAAPKPTTNAAQGTNQPAASNAAPKTQGNVNVPTPDLAAASNQVEESANTSILALLGLESAAPKAEVQVETPPAKQPDVSATAAPVEEAQPKLEVASVPKNEEPAPAPAQTAPKQADTPTQTETASTGAQALEQSWRFEDVNVTFSGGKYYGKTGCNEFSGRYVRWLGNRVKIFKPKIGDSTCDSSKSQDANERFTRNFEGNYEILFDGNNMFLMSSRTTWFLNSAK